MRGQKMLEDYSNTFETNAEPKFVFKALTEQIDLWWTTSTNKAKKVNDELKVEFGNNTFKLMRVVSVYPDQSLAWQVIEAHINHEELNNKNEWVGTIIRWTIHSIDNGSQIEFVHKGLTTKMECWGICSNGWDYFLGSLKAFLNSGKGTPYNNEY
jgi:hypothetical protein